MAYEGMACVEDETNMDFNCGFAGIHPHFVVYSVVYQCGNTYIFKQNGNVAIVT
jgi:hypothetical protein